MSAICELDAEQAVLGAVLLRNESAAHANVRAEHFYDPTHAALWAEMSRRYREGRVSDAVALKAFAAEALRQIGGAAYLLTLMERACPLTSQVIEYASMIRDAARRRATIGAAEEAIAAARRGGEGDALTQLEARLQEIAADDLDADAWTPLGVHAVESVERAAMGETRGLSTGFERLDCVTGGIQPGTLWVVGGATSMGKSVFGAALSRAIAAQGYGVAEAHLEMDAAQVGLRAAAALAFRPDHRFAAPHYLSAQRGDLRPEQWDVLRGAAKAAADLPIYIDARPGRTLSQIEAAARRLFRAMLRQGVRPGALVIDHEGLIAVEAGARFPSQLERANARSEGLLALAKRLDVAVIALSQITKEGARADGEDRLPTAHDLSYGGALSQAASVVILLHRKAYYAERKPKHLRTPEDADAMRSRECVLVVDKARAGQREQVSVLMDMPTAAVWP